VLDGGEDLDSTSGVGELILLLAGEGPDELELPRSERGLLRSKRSDGRLHGRGLRWRGEPEQESPGGLDELGIHLREEMGQRDRGDARDPPQ
jgi:hypothetical protein